MDSSRRPIQEKSTQENVKMVYENVQRMEESKKFVGSGDNVMPKNKCKVYVLYMK